MFIFNPILVRGKPTLFIPLKEVDIKTTASQNLLDGLGQSKETLSKQKKILEEKKKRTLANKKYLKTWNARQMRNFKKILTDPKVLVECLEQENPKKPKNTGKNY